MQGNAAEVRNETEQNTVAQGALRLERPAKEIHQSHAEGLDGQRLQDEADRISAALQNLTEPNSPHKGHFIVRVSEDFVSLAGPEGLERMMEQVRKRIPGNLFLSTFPGEAGVYCFKSVDHRQFMAHTPTEAGAPHSGQNRRWNS